MKNIVLKKNLSFILPILILLTVSLLNMYGARFINAGAASNVFTKQLVWSLIGFASMILIYRVNPKFLKKHAGLFYFLGCLSLVLVLIFGKNINGARSWFKFGPFSFQPSELFKFFYLIYLSKVIAEHEGKQFYLFLKILVLTAIPCFLIFLEPDTGVVLMYILMMFGLLWASGMSKKYPLILIGSALIFIVFFFGLYFLNGDIFTRVFGLSFFYRIDRLISFKNVSSYQLNNALIGVGSSGLFGFGLTHPKIYIPEATTDFVFDLTICNFGLIMGLFIAIIYGILLKNIYRVLNKTANRMDRTILAGILFMMSFQVSEHIFMNLGITPITGITLPFLSYGGSSLISYFLLFGLILKITTNSSSYN